MASIGLPVAACAPSEPTHDDDVIYLWRDQTQAENLLFVFLGAAPGPFGIQPNAGRA